jgi:hypothetical protein
MLEIIILVGFVRRLAAIAKSKGRSGSWGGLGALFWIGGELIGFVVGAVTANDVGAGVYVLALVFAAIGATMAWVIVKNLRPLNEEEALPLPIGASAQPLPTKPADLSNPYAPPRV